MTQTDTQSHSHTHTLTDSDTLGTHTPPLHTTNSTIIWPFKADRFFEEKKDRIIYSYRDEFNQIVQDRSGF